LFPDENWVECIDMKQNSLPLAKISFGAVPKFWGLFDMCPTSPYLRDFYIWEFCFLGHTTWFRSHHQLQFFPRSFPPPPQHSLCIPCFSFLPICALHHNFVDLSILTILDTCMNHDVSRCVVSKIVHLIHLS